MIRAGLLATVLVGAGAVDSLAQPAWVAGVDVVAARSAPAFIGGGVSLGAGISRELTVVGRGMLGRQAGAVIERGELVLEFRPFDRASGGPAPYLGVGVAASGGIVRGPFLLAVAGLRFPSSPRAGWVLEAGVAGGFRFAAGYRFSIGGRKRRTAARGSRSFRSK